MNLLAVFAVEVVHRQQNGRQHIRANCFSASPRRSLSLSSLPRCHLLFGGIWTSAAACVVTLRDPGEIAAGRTNGAR